MKKIKNFGVKAFCVAAMASALVACNEGMKGNDNGDRERDSLRNIIDQKDNEINDLMGTFNEIQQGFDLINEAEGRVNMLKDKKLNGGDRYEIENVDITIALQEPKLRPYVDRMRETLARIMGIDKSQVSVKATTTEHLGFVGRGEGCEVWATVQLITKSAKRIFFWT